MLSTSEPTAKAEGRGTDASGGSRLGLLGGWVPHQARVLFPGQFSLENLALSLLLLHCLFQSKYLCTQLQDLVLLCLEMPKKQTGR